MILVFFFLFFNPFFFIIFTKFTTSSRRRDFLRFFYSHKFSVIFSIRFLLSSVSSKSNLIRSAFMIRTSPSFACLGILFLKMSIIFSSSFSQTATFSVIFSPSLCSINDIINWFNRINRWWHNRACVKADRFSITCCDNCSL